MKLLIISNMPHYRRDGQIVGWGPTVQEIDHLAQVFQEIRHIACLYPGQAPPSTLPYSSERISLIPVPPAGGPRFRDKLGILRLTPLYIRTILKELPTADVVHVRCPANISLLAIVLLGLVRHPRARWVKYAGNWRPDGHESWSYTFQRWWLHHNLHFGKVTINGSWPDQKPHEITFPNPSLTRAELAEAARYASQKVFTPPYRCAFVGRLERKKGPVALLEAVRQLRVEGIQVEADLIGDGPEAFEIKKLAQDLFAEGKVRFHGWTSRQELPEFLKNAHFIVLPTSCSEGWPKVLSEGMAYGVVPITTAISAIPHYLTSQENAWLLHQPTWSEVVVGIKWFVAKPERWLRCQRNALDSAHQFTYEHYLERLMNTVLPNRSVVIE